MTQSDLSPENYGVANAQTYIYGTDWIQVTKIQDSTASPSTIKMFCPRSSSQCFAMISLLDLKIFSKRVFMRDGITWMTS